MKIEIKRTPKKRQKGAMARRLVYFCVAVLTIAALWSMVLMTVCAVAEIEKSIDLSAPLTFIGAAFGGELLMLLAKRVFAKPTDTEEEEANE